MPKLHTLKTLHQAEERFLLWEDVGGLGVCQFLRGSSAGACDIDRYMCISF